MNTFSGYLNSFTAEDLPQKESSQIKEPITTPEVVKNTEETDPTPEDTVANGDDLQHIIDFTLSEQHGNTHTLSEYEGKIVFLNFRATGCPPCQKEIPQIVDLL